MEGARLDFMSAAARLVQPVCHKRAAISTLAIYIPASGLIHYNRLARDRAATRGAPARNAESFCTVHFGTAIYHQRNFPIFSPGSFSETDPRKMTEFLLPLWNTHTHTHVHADAHTQGSKCCSSGQRIFDGPWRSSRTWLRRCHCCMFSKFIRPLIDKFLTRWSGRDRTITELNDTRCWLPMKKKVPKWLDEFITVRDWTVIKRLRVVNFLSVYLRTLFNFKEGKESWSQWFSKPIKLFLLENLKDHKLYSLAFIYFFENIRAVKKEETRSNSTR